MNKTNRFANVLDAARGKEHEEEQPPEEALDTDTKKRALGKRANSDFIQVTAYIRRDTHKAAKIALLQETKQREFSELVEDLISEWVKSRT